MSNPFSNLIDWIRSRFSPQGEWVEDGGGDFAKAKGNRRQFHRFNYSYKVTFMSGMKSFKTVCQDISLGGMKLKYPLPPSFWGIECKVIIEGTSEKDSIVFNCKTLVDSVVPKRVSFSETDVESQRQLERWLIERISRGNR